MTSMGPETMAGLDPRLAQLGGQQPLHVPGLMVTMLRSFFWFGAASCLFAAVLLTQLLWSQGKSLGTALLFVALGLLFAAAARLPPVRLPTALTWMTTAITLAMAGACVWQSWSLASPGLAITGLMVCLLAVAAGWRAGSFLAVVAALSLLVVGWATRLTSTLPASTQLTHLGLHLLCVALGLAAGVLISQLLSRYMRAAQEREARFRSLLALAADAYWELDDGYRLAAASTKRGELRAVHGVVHGVVAGAVAAQGLGTPPGLGQVPWELPHFICDPETLDMLRADMDQRQAFHDVPIQWRTQRPGGPDQVRDYLLSGEPRFNNSGIFTGYWGVGRDVTQANAAKASLALTETRYRELFSRIPTPLVLHRSGVVLEANPSALALFGAPGEAAMVGRDLLSFFASGDSRERARRRVELLQGQPLGTALPVTDFKLMVPGREVAVRETGVRVDAEGGPALLTILVDDTDRLAGEEAVRRSEAMLSHLVATSPDLITLTDMASGRYVMVNHAFERISGWRSDQAIGHTSTELGIWSEAGAREAFLARLREHGEVNDVPTQFVGKDGQRFSLVVSAARFVMDRRDYMVINARDVTEKERERAQNEAILLSASVGIAVTSQGRFTLTNHHFDQIHGFKQGELVGQDASIIFPQHDGYDEARAHALPFLARGEVVEMEQLAQRKDGGTFLARIRGRAVDPGDPRRLGIVWIFEDITQRHQAEEALARARDDAEAANRAKSAFLANTSHELRTPLNGMIGLAGLARAEDLAPALRRQYLDQIAQSAQSLAGIISDILDLSKIEAGKLQLDHTRFYLADELRTLAKTYALLAADKHITLGLDIAPEVEGAVMGDALRVRQIVSNLLANAVKFTPQGGVRLRLLRLSPPQEDSVRIEVHDTGPGVDEAARALLFKPFSQGDQSTTRRFGGTGLGLSICHELATLMGGEVGVHSELGRGSVFWVQLPLPPATLHAHTSTALPMAQLHDMHEQSQALRGKRVLMVEDNAVNMMIAVAMLEGWGVAVSQAHDGQQAVSLVQRETAAGRPFDAVLMDVHMPVMSGYEATLALRAQSGAERGAERGASAAAAGGGRHLPIIALTAAALVTERDAALRVGMDAFLTKPIDAHKLLTTLLRWCGSSSPAERTPVTSPPG
jgi:PAS domain S-box-containing protein